jgi:hypothetical protein
MPRALLVLLIVVIFASACSIQARRPGASGGDAAVVFSACKREGPGSSSWRGATQFNGAVIVPRPHCVTLSVVADDRKPLPRIRAAFGRDTCPQKA